LVQKAIYFFSNPDCHILHVRDHTKNINTINGGLKITEQGYSCEKKKHFLLEEKVRINFEM
jgi:hypothetical protein